MLTNLAGWVEMETLGSLIARLREQRGLTQGELARLAGVPREWLSVVELDRVRKPDRERLERIALALEMPPETLLATAGYRVKPLPPPERRTPYQIARELEAALREAPILVPETTGHVSAGVGAPAEAEPWPYLPKPGERHHRFIAVPVVGDCMEPEIMEGHRVIVDVTAAPDAKPGDIVVARVDEEHLVKRLEQRHGRLYLVALRGQPPIEVKEGVEIIGIVRAASYRPR